MVSAINHVRAEPFSERKAAILYELRDVYNADEFGLFYQQPPTKIFHLRGERCPEVKLSKVRLTGLAAGNGVGKKLPMFIIKAEKPRCFKGVKSLPCQYMSQNNSWMGSKIFTDYVRRLDAKFNAEGRKLALIIDNCQAHTNVENLKAIELVFLPPNTTSKTQPMDQGVIRALKTFHRKNVVRRQIKYIDAGKTTPNINILEAMSIKAGISKEISVTSINGEEDPFELLEKNVKDLISRGLVEKDFAVEDYINIDFDISTSKAIAITDREILDSILINDCGEVDEEIDEDSTNLPPVKPKLSEVARAIELIECWFLFENNGVEIRQSLILVSKMFDKHSLEAKNNQKWTIFSKN
ncbi:tigger transposable element-derived protein 4-like [Hydra vulgaris]|uniref:tigger transposable element-derived protein 4-like n=1 Tax=Hydra vulgaris TaxID=6087 RepID=UPI0032EA30F5